MGDTNTVLPQFVSIPANFPKEPSPGKINILFDANSKEIYHKHSPFGWDKGNIFGPKQPYIWNLPSERSPLTKIGGRGLPFGFSLVDTERLSKFMVSGRGILFLGQQFLLQAFQPYNETKLYNPVEVILSASRGITFGFLPRPQRHIDLGNGFLGAIASVLGFNSQQGRNPPPGTVGDKALANINKDQGAGLLRGVTASAGYNMIKTKWEGSGNQKSGFLGAVGNYFKSQLAQLGQGLLPVRNPPGTQYKADEKTYDLMIDNNGFILNYDVVTKSDYFVLKKYNKGKGLFKSNVSSNFVFLRKTDEKYLDSVQPTKTEKISLLEKLHKEINKDDSVKSDNKQNDLQSDAVKNRQNSLRKILDGIKDSGYEIHIGTHQRGITNPDDTLIGYTRVDNSARDYGDKYTDDFKGKVRTLDPITSRQFSYKFSGKNRSDGINRLTILDNSRMFNKMDNFDILRDDLGIDFTGWEKYEPYDDDLIAFFFYDVVNEVYIPFRATVKGVNESNNAIWDELAFIGRADRLYSYNGFTRNLSFNFSIIISSVKELFPTWKRINYLASSIKPSLYNTAQSSEPGVIYNRFAVPPMFMITIGDLYKFQPIVMTAINVIIPDNATWELMSESSPDDWNYLTRIIQWPKSKGKFAQLPMEAEISINCNILEKERAIVGGNHYGHSPVIEPDIETIHEILKKDKETVSPETTLVTGIKDKPLISKEPYLPEQSAFSKNLRRD